MEISFKAISIFLAIILTGLSAGLFYGWQVSVIPGTKKILDIYYLETMQSINRAILNPAFFASFFGSLIFLVLASIVHYGTNTSVFVLLVASTIIYLIGTFGVTAFGNVPLNNQLDALSLSELNINELKDFRLEYELKWNKLHLIRSVFGVLSFSLALLALFFQHK
ncbi:anthrone oxygenase family protein [Aureicoccus marinus]|uniref:DUF1772 domain-containing protein n=1 Tax=Aureicoccus marinus TaxID=754435 RepID=A0A2S7T8E1_9FLAO|nr:anthrone oxygenase family protein [Aureicoccus marinus]PQJ15777.1 hypothetical protein BST99_08610 [Aureicoccus marinus]